MSEHDDEHGLEDDSDDLELSLDSVLGVEETRAPASDEPQSADEVSAIIDSVEEEPVKPLIEEPVSGDDGILNMLFADEEEAEEVAEDPEPEKVAEEEEVAEGFGEAKIEADEDAPLPDLESDEADDDEVAAIFDEEPEVVGDDGVLDEESVDLPPPGSEIDAMELDEPEAALEPGPEPEPEDLEDEDEGEKLVFSRNKPAETVEPSGNWPPGKAAASITGNLDDLEPSAPEEEEVRIFEDPPESEPEEERAATVLPPRRNLRKKKVLKAPKADNENLAPAKTEEAVIQKPKKRGGTVPFKKPVESREFGDIDAGNTRQAVSREPLWDEEETLGTFEEEPRTVARNTRRPRSTRPTFQSGWDLKTGGQKKMIIIALVATVAVIAIVASLLSRNGDEGGGGSNSKDPGSAGSGTPAGTGAEAREAPKPIDQTEGMELMPLNGTQDEVLKYLETFALETANVFFGAKNIDELIMASREPERVRPLMEDYYSRKPMPSPKECESVMLSEVLMRGNRTFLLGSAKHPGDRAHWVVMEKTPKGLLMDWEYFVKYSPMLWDAYIADKPQDSLDFRVYCTASQDYVPPFDDNTVFYAVEIRGHGTESTLLGYVTRDSSDGRILQTLLDGEFELPIMLRLRFPPEGAPEGNAVVIEELVSESWILAD